MQSPSVPARSRAIPGHACRRNKGGGPEKGSTGSSPLAYRASAPRTVDCRSETSALTACAARHRVAIDVSPRAAQMNPARLAPIDAGGEARWSMTPSPVSAGATSRYWSLASSNTCAASSALSLPLSRPARAKHASPSSVSGRRPSSSNASSIGSEPWAAARCFKGIDVDGIVRTGCQAEAEPS